MLMVAMMMMITMMMQEKWLHLIFLVFHENTKKIFVGQTGGPSPWDYPVRNRTVRVHGGGLGPPGSVLGDLGWLGTPFHPTILCWCFTKKIKCMVIMAMTPLTM